MSASIGMIVLPLTSGGEEEKKNGAKNHQDTSSKGRSQGKIKTHANLIKPSLVLYYPV